MTKNRICYKVVSVQHDMDDNITGMVSSVAYGTKLNINYEIGKLVRPMEGTPIFTFKTIADAQAGLRTVACGPYAILECKYTKKFRVQDSIATLCWIDDDYIEDIVNFWKTKVPRQMETLPMGTLLVYALTPIRIVEQSELP